MKQSVISNNLRGTIFFLFFVLCSIAYAGTDYYCDFSVNGIYYQYVSGTADEVAVSYNNYETGRYGGNYTNYSGYVSVPATVTYNGKTYKVTAVSNHAFQECSVTTVSLPNTIKSIGYAAFLDCYQLTSVNLPSSITTIGDNAFNGCTVLGNVTLPTALKSIGNNAFQNCKTFTSIDIPNGVTTIGASAFSSCSNLASISIPSSVVSVGSSAFSGTAWYTNLPNGMVYFGSIAYNYKGTMPENTTIEIKEGTTSIAGGAFTNCVNLVSISIPSSVTYIGNNAFYYCSGLKSVDIPYNVKNIETNTFAGCTSLTSVKISDGVISIGPYAFSGCRSLKSLNVPNSITGIGYYAFSGCSGLTSVTIGSGVSEFGDYAFYGCTNLSSLEIKDGVTSIGNYTFQSCSNLSSINLPNSLISIGIKAFDGCSWIANLPDGVVYAGKVAYSYKGSMSDYTNITLKEGTLGIATSAFSSYSLLSAVTLPSSLINIGPGAFYNCSNLTSVTALMEVPVPIYSSIFNYSNFATLYVPTGCKAAYEAADYWKDFKEIVESSPQTQDRFDVTDENGVKMTYQIVSESDKTCEVLDADHSAEKIVIPVEVNGYKVVGIADGAFYREVETSYWEYSSNPSPYFDSSYYPIKKVTCLSTTPITVGENAFMAKYYFVQSYVTGQDEYGNDLYFEGQVSVDQQSTVATLVVPNGCYDAYDDADISRYFETIVEIQPALTDKETLSVEDIETRSGSAAEMAINLTNESEDLTAFQFDLILPDGISLSVNDKGKYVVYKTSRYEDDSQTLNVSKLEGSENAYRFVCFSMSNGVITGKSGAILNAVLAIGESVNEGSYEAKIKNIIVTKTDGAQLKLNDAKFNIVVSNVILGDANGDGNVNVTDIVEIVNYIMEKPSDRFVAAAADLNGDGYINVTDIVKVVSIIMSANTNAPKRVSAMEMIDNEQLTLDVNDRVYSLHLDNEAQYVASQFEIRLGDGQTLEGVLLNGERSDGHQVTYTQTGNNLYKVVVFSTENHPFNCNNGELLSFKVSGNGNVEVSNILFVTSGETEKLFPSLYAGMTGIDVIKTADTMDVYSIDGRLVRRQVTNTNSLEKGMYIINGKKTIVK